MVLHPASFLVAVLATLQPVIVRRAAPLAGDELLIKVHLAGQPVKTLQRPAAETLARSLSRISRAFAPPKGRRAKGAHVDPEPCHLLDARGAELDPSMSAGQAWSGAARLHVGASSLDVLFEPAEVVSLALPTVVPFVGVPLTPTVETVGCDARECRWEWERLSPGAPADCWQLVGSRREYQPTDADDGARVRVRAVPPAPGRARAALHLLAAVAEATAPVEAPPPRRLLASRVRAMGAVPAGALRVLSYNVLADCYSRHWDRPGSIHSYCAPRLTRAAHRMPRLLGEVLAFAPDLVLLQEVDRSWFEQYWLPAMRQVRAPALST